MITTFTYPKFTLRVPLASYCLFNCSPYLSIVSCIWKPVPPSPQTMELPLLYNLALQICPHHLRPWSYEQLASFSERGQQKLWQYIYIYVFIYYFFNDVGMTGLENFISFAPGLVHNKVGQTGSKHVMTSRFHLGHYI